MQCYFRAWSVKRFFIPDQHLPTCLQFLQILLSKVSYYILYFSFILTAFVSPERMFVGTHSDPNSVCPSVLPLKFWLTFFKLLLFEQVRFNYNQTWIIGALWEPSHYDTLGGHMTWSKVIWGQIVIVISVNLQIAPVRTGSLQLQPNLVHRCTMGTFSLWRSSRSHDKVKGHWRSNCYSYFS